MRILHTADWHVGDLNGPTIESKNARQQDTLRCADYLVEYAQNENPDAILIAGDIFDKSKLWGDNMLSLIDAVAQRLRLLTKVAPTVLMFGTDNHDSLKAFENINSMKIPGLKVITTPDLFTVYTGLGHLQVACLPGLDKGHFRTKFPSMAPAEESIMCSKLLGDMVNGLSAQLDPTIPSVLMAHYTVVGCELDNGQHVFTQSEIVLPKEALAGSAFDLVALGHIHRAQQVECAGKPVFYSGPVNGITFNEEGQDKGFYVHEINEKAPFGPHYTGSEFIETPYRKFWTTKWNNEDVQEFLDGKWPMNPDCIKDKIIRVHYSCTDELNKQLNRKALEKSLYEAGAFHVAEIKPEKITTALAKQELTETSGPLENLATWLTAEGLTPEEINSILELSRPLIATVSAKMPTGTLSGVFEPRSLSVKNYRSYLEESLSFHDIYFAIVNGKNGIGKSSLFMDAISDCLYEETRIKVVGEWITTGQTDGMITFEFSMGATNWRVIRNRSIKASGKITLALQEQIGDVWENRSGTTTRDTQEKIETLLGMDCATFQCTALIMQDAYGKFMEASKEERMGVLANILGLSVYEQLTDLAKVKVSELNKSLAISKVKLAELDEKLKGKAGLEFSLKSYETELNLIAGNIAAKEAELKTAEELVRTLESKSEKAEDLRIQVLALKGEILNRQGEIVIKRQASERAQKILDSEATILEKAEQYETIKEQVLVLQTKQPKALELRTDQTRLIGDINSLESQINKTVPQIFEFEKVLASKDELDLAASRYSHEVIELAEMDLLATQEAELTRLTTLAERDVDKNAEEIRLKELKRDELIRKSAMLENANCVDPENAKCAFLADAQKAKAEMPIIEKEIIALIDAKAPIYQVVKDLDTKYAALGYGKTVHSELRKSVAELRPKAELASQLDSKSVLLTGLRGQISDHKKRVNDMQVRLDVITKANAVLQDELAVLPSLTERLPKLLQWVNAKEELPATRQIVISTADVIKGIEADIATKEGQIQAMESERVLLGIETTELSPAKVAARRTSDDLKWLQQQQLDYTSKIGALTAQLEALAKDNAERKRISDEMVPAVRELTHYQTLTKAFGNDGIPFSIIRSIVPELSNMANDILGQMTGGEMSLKIETERVQKNKKEVNAIEVMLITFRGERPYGNHSGGQRVKAALANAFALADLKARRAGIQLGMMHIDEPPFLDSEGMEAYCDALEGLNFRNPNMKITAISHDPAMKARFPQQIEVVDMGEEGSKVRIA